MTAEDNIPDQIDVAVDAAKVDEILDIPADIGPGLLGAPHPDMPAPPATPTADSEGGDIE